MRLKILFFSFLFVVVFAAGIFLSFWKGPKSSVVAQTKNAVINESPVTNKPSNVNQSAIKPTDTAVPSPTIVSRQEWKAKDPVGTVKEHIIRFITIHHTATLQKKVAAIEKKMQSLQNFSQSKSLLATGKMKPVWFDVPYHYYIAFDGKIAEGRDILFVGDTNTDYDPTGHALVVLEGNFETEQPSAEQFESLQDLAAWLSAKYYISASEIKAHNDYASTACPGKNLKKLLPQIRESISTF